MILSDFDLENYIKDKRLVIDPIGKDTIRENGVDLRISDEVAYYTDEFNNINIDISDEEVVKKLYTIEKKVSEIIINSRSHVLLSTVEKVTLPDDLMGFVELRSTAARHGLAMPPTIIDAGFSGTITLEVFNNAPYNIILKPGTRFAHVIFARTTTRVKNPYKGTYFEQSGVKTPKAMK
ncbi:MAG: dCTP deaminase [Candidatus Marsarchaeota archaeon]|nr:dCTP deaminase [Candidatus Marsarchaeota archaeon]